MLALLSLGGLVWPASRRGRRPPETAVAWALLGVAGMALLAPALALPDGIPSPAASLGAYTPWQGELDPAAGNPVLRDVTHQIQPWLLFLRRELSEGRLPFWNPHQHAGAPFWSNGQSAPLNPFHLLFAALPASLGWVLLPWLRFVVAGLGAFRLARALGLELPGGLTAALIYPLSGMLVSFLSFPMGNALALVPWVLWAVERLVVQRRDPHPNLDSRESGNPVPALALATGLQMLGGHPETVIHTAFLSTVYLGVRLWGRSWGAIAAIAWRFAAAWAAGAALAAVQLVPMAWTILDSSKWQQHAPGGEVPLSLALAQLLRLALPQLYGHPAEGTWWGPFNYSATAVYAGALALPLAAAGLAGLRRDRRWLALGLAALAALAVAYRFPGFFDLARSLPAVGRVTHHRLIFGVELGLALLAGRGLERWLAGRGRGLVAGAAALGAALAAAWALFAGDWAGHGLGATQVAWTAWGVAMAVLAAASLRLSATWRSRLWPLVPALLVVDLVAAHGGIHPGLSRTDFYPETPAVRFLTGREGRVAGAGGALHPNAALVHGLYDLRGDDPVKLERFEAAYRRLSDSSPVYFRPIERWDEPLLDRLGVRWVVAAPRRPPPAVGGGWGLAYDGADARVWERPSALPLVRRAEGSAEGLSVEVRSPGRWEIEAEGPGRLVVAETWDPGWRAAVDGEPVPVERVEGLFLGVEVPAGVRRGSRRVSLFYRPRGFLAGGAASLLALGLLAGLSIRGSSRESSSPRGPASPP